MRGKGFNCWRLFAGVAAVGVLAFGVELQGTPGTDSDPGVYRYDVEKAILADDAGGGIEVTGRAVTDGATPFRVEERFGASPGQGGVAGGPGTACICDSDCGDGNICTTDTCVGGICEQVFATGVACDATDAGDTTFCSLGQCDAAGTCLNNDLGGSPCDDGVGGTETCNETTDNCDGVECTVDADCSGGAADPLLCQANVCTEGNCRIDFVCLDGQSCDGAGVCSDALDGRCCVDLAACANTTLAACDGGGGPGTGPWANLGGTCVCPKASHGINDNAGTEFIFSISASANCTTGGVAGAANFAVIGDDYTTDNNSFLLLEEFRFVGGVAGDGDRTAIFEFWDGSVDPPILADAFGIQFGVDQTGVFQWIITLTGGDFVIPPVGWVTMRPAAGGGETVTWFSTNENDGAIGGNNINLMWADDERRDVLLPTGPNILAFELTGTKVNPVGHCCLGEGNCNDTTLNVVWLCEDAGGTFVPDIGTCPVGACSSATCCFTDGTCQVLDPTACTSGGGIVGTFGATCDLNCCPQAFTAGPECGTSVGDPHILDTAAAGPETPLSVRISGDNSAATSGHCDVSTTIACNTFTESGSGDPGACPAGETCIADEACVPASDDVGHWETFTITAESDVTVGFCCNDDTDGAAPGVRWIIVYSDCAACTTILRTGDAGGAAGGAACADGNPADLYKGLPAGTYHYAVYGSRVCTGTTDNCITDADCAPGVVCNQQTGTYELEITAKKTPFVPCCLADSDICVDPITAPEPLTEVACLALGGNPLVGVVDCFGSPCASGSCCLGPGVCDDQGSPTGITIGDCHAQAGTFVGGALCADDPCPVCTLDDLVNGGPECNTALETWLIQSDLANSEIVNADDFIPATTGLVTEICWDAVGFVPNGLACCNGELSDVDAWRITFYEDLNGLPGAPIGPANGQLAQNVISDVNSVGDCFQIKTGTLLTGVPVSAGTTYWVSIGGTGAGLGNDGCNVGVSAASDGNSYMASGSQTIGWSLDTTFGGQSVADLGICIDQGWGTPDRTGACCTPLELGPITCHEVTPTACNDLGGVMQPGVAACAADTCPGACEAETCAETVSLDAPGEACEFGLPCNREYTNTNCDPTVENLNCGAGNHQFGRDTWFSYKTTADECGEFTIQTCGGTGDGIMAVYNAGPNCTCPGNTGVANWCDDDSGCGAGAEGHEKVTFTATANTCYLIRLGGWNGNIATATAQLSMVLDPAGCAAATPEPVLPDDAFDVNGSTVACGSDADCTNEAICRNGACYVPKNRFVSVMPNPANAGSLTARRVCVDLPGALCGWLDAPITHNPAGPGPLPVLVSDLVAAPVYRDWSADPVDSQGRTVVHISGCRVSPIHTYLIQSINQGADINLEANYSAVTALPTVGVWGDVLGAGSVATPPNAVANFADIQGAIKGFQQNQGAPKTWLKVKASLDAADPSTISLVEDVFKIVAAFQGATYPGTQPVDCP